MYHNSLMFQTGPKKLYFDQKGHQTSHYALALFSQEKASRKKCDWRWTFRASKRVGTENYRSKTWRPKNSQGGNNLTSQIFSVQGATKVSLWPKQKQEFLCEYVGFGLSTTRITKTRLFVMVKVSFRHFKLVQLSNSAWQYLPLELCIFIFEHNLASQKRVFLIERRPQGQKVGHFWNPDKISQKMKQVLSSARHF